MIKTSFAKIVIGLIAFASILLGTAGCGGSGEQQNYIAYSKNLNKPSKQFEDSSTAYLLSQPYDKIIVEIDIVKDAELTDECLNMFVKFLETKTGKKVIIRRSEIENIHKVGPRVLAMQNVTGLTENDGDSAAYIYILLFRGENKGVAGVATSNFPCGFILNIAKFGPTPNKILPYVLMHEACHLFNMTTGPHGDGVHCKSEQCLMYPGSIFSISSWLFGMNPIKNTMLCEDCEKELAESKKSTTPCKIKFNGPFLIRQEKDYYVAMLPSHLHFSYGEIDKGQLDAVLKYARGNAHKLSGGRYSTTVLHCNHKHVSEQVKQELRALKAASKDKDHRVRDIAKQAQNDFNKRHPELNAFSK